METPYKREWDKFRASSTFERLLSLAKITTNIDEKYLINRIQSAFDAGWSAAHEIIKEQNKIS